MIRISGGEKQGVDSIMFLPGCLEALSSTSSNYYWRARELQAFPLQANF